MPWYRGPTLLDHLHSVEVTGADAERPFRFPVQWVNRPNGEFRGFSGTVVSGSIAPGDAVLVAGSGRSARVKEIVTFDGSLDRARPRETRSPSPSTARSTSPAAICSPTPRDRPNLSTSSPRM